MKKLISVILSMVMVFSLFGISSQAGSVLLEYDFESGDIYYIVDDGGTACVVGYDDETDRTEIVIPDTVRNKRKTYDVVSIYGEAFADSPFTSITVGKNVSYIGDAAFSSSTKLETVIIPDECYFYYFGADVFTGSPVEGNFYSQDETILGQNVLFSYCGSAKEYTIPDNIELIVPGCFMFSGIEKINFNSSVTEIPEFAFACCRQLKEVTIPDGIYYLGYAAFKDCTKLETVVLGDDVEYIGEKCFENTGLRSVHLGRSVMDVAGSFVSCPNLRDITIDPENEFILVNETGVFEKEVYVFNVTEDGETADVTGMAIEYVFPDKAKGNITLDDEVVAIGAYTFFNCRELESVSANNLIYVGYKAFANSTIKRFDGGDKLFEIDDSAFLNCSQLEYVDLRTTNLIGMSAFENCTNIKSVLFDDQIWEIREMAFRNTGLSEVEIYGEDCYINESAFKDCKDLKTVVFGDGVYSLGVYLFTNCPSLETISLSKTIEWIEEETFSECENVKFLLIKGSDAYKFIESRDFDFEIVGKLSFVEMLTSFFEDLFDFLFGWLFF